MGQNVPFQAASRPPAGRAPGPAPARTSGSLAGAGSLLGRPRLALRADQPAERRAEAHHQAADQRERLHPAGHQRADRGDRLHATRCSAPPPPSAPRRRRWSPRTRRRWSSAASCRSAPSSPSGKVPILGDIPLLGLPVPRDRRGTRSKTNLLLFLTPYIIRDAARLPPHLRAEDGRAAAVRGGVLRAGAGLRRADRLQPQAGPAGAHEPDRPARGDEGRERRPGHPRRAAHQPSRQTARGAPRAPAADAPLPAPGRAAASRSARRRSGADLPDRRGADRTPTPQAAPAPARAPEDPAPPSGSEQQRHADAASTAARTSGPRPAADDRLPARARRAPSHVVAHGPAFLSGARSGEILRASRRTDARTKLEEALAAQAEKGGRLGEVLVGLKAVAEEDVAKALAAAAGPALPPAHLRGRGGCRAGEAGADQLRQAGADPPAAAGGRRRSRWRWPTRWTPRCWTTRACCCGASVHAAGRRWPAPIVDAINSVYDRVGERGRAAGGRDGGAGPGHAWPTSWRSPRTSSTRDDEAPDHPAGELAALPRRQGARERHPHRADGARAAGALPRSTACSRRSSSRPSATRTPSSAA